MLPSPHEPKTPPEKPGPEASFDPSLPPWNPANREAAAERGWYFDLKLGVYVDEDGCLMADRYGQPL